MNHSTQHPDEYAAFTTPTNTPAAEDTQGPHAHHGARHHWLMWLMCLPMVAIVGFLVLTGAAGGGAILYALGCMAMMGVMMLFMNHGTQNSGHHH